MYFWVSATLRNRWTWAKAADVMVLETMYFLFWKDNKNVPSYWKKQYELDFSPFHLLSLYVRKKCHFFFAFYFKNSTFPAVALALKGEAVLTNYHLSLPAFYKRMGGKCFFCISSETLWILSMVLKMWNWIIKTGKI